MKLDCVLLSLVTKEYVTKDCYLEVEPKGKITKDFYPLSHALEDSTPYT